MKRFVTLALAAAFCLTLAVGCGGDDAAKPKTGTTTGAPKGTGTTPTPPAGDKK